MKKISIAIILLTMSIVSFSAPNPEVTEKVLTSFKKMFNDPKDPTWNENAYGYEVRFLQDGIDSRVWYDKEGNMIKTHRYYGEFNLPPFILGKLKKKYDDKSVFGVTEVFDEAGLQYFIKLQDDKNWLTVKSDAGGNMEVFEKLKKAK